MNYGSLAQAAYDRLETLIVTTELRPGARTTLSELERLSGLGRTPVHDAVKRMAAVSLLLVQPRSGLRIAPLDLAQEKLLLPVRIEMEAIACRLAAERAAGTAAARLSEAAAALRASGSTMSLAEFNVVDTQLNAGILLASGETMLGNTLMPLQTLYRRSGWLYLTKLGQPALLKDVITSHLTLLDLVLARDAQGAERQVRFMLQGVDAALSKLQSAGIGQEVVMMRKQ